MSLWGSVRIREFVFADGKILLHKLRYMPILQHIITSMKKTLATAILVLFLFTGCKKAIQNAQENLLIKAMTDGQWTVVSFTQGGTDITNNFTGYKYQYYKNKTVDAIKDGNVQKTGTWDGDPTTMTTWANF